MAGLNIVYTTRRAEPRFDWFADSLAAQLDGDGDVSVIVVDGRHDARRTAALDAIVADRFAFHHVPPMPSAVIGHHRLTRRDYHGASSARNTGLVHADKPYVAFVDDCSVLMPGWLEEVRGAQRDGYVVLGAYAKRWEMVVEAGTLMEGSRDAVAPDAVDSRWDQGSDDGPVPISGGQLFGCSFAAPRSLLVEVNGFDGLCDTIGGEDWHLGVRLEWAGGLLCYSRRMFTVESEELHRQGTPAMRIDPLMAPDAYLARLQRFGVGERVFADRRTDWSNLILDVTYGLRGTRSLGNHYDLATLTPDDLPGTAERLPRTHWADGRALADL